MQTMMESGESNSLPNSLNAHICWIVVVGFISTLDFRRTETPKRQELGHKGSLVRE